MDNLDFSKIYKLINKIDGTYNSIANFDFNDFQTKVSKLSDLQSLPDNIASATSSLEDSLSDFQQQVELRRQIQSTIVDINTNISKISPDILAINDAFSNLPTQITEITTNIKNAIGLLDTIPEQISSIGSQIDGINTITSGIDTVIISLQDIANQIKPTLENLKTAIDKLNISELHTGIQNDLEKITSTLTSLQTAKDKLTDLEKITELDTVINSLGNIPTALNDILTNTKTIEQIIPETSELLNIFNQIISDGTKLDTDLTGKLSDLLQQVVDVEVYLQYMENIHSAISEFSPNLDKLTGQVKRIADYGDLSTIISEPLEHINDRLDDAQNVVSKISDFVLKIPSQILELVSTILNAIIEALSNAITDYLPYLIIGIICVMLFMYLYPTIIGVIM
jgi:DNA repair ATPase RecN